MKFSGISWLGNEGFFYSSYDKPDGSELSARTDQHKVYFHRLGTAQEDDRLVFGAIPAQHHRCVGRPSPKMTASCSSRRRTPPRQPPLCEGSEPENAPLLTVQGIWMRT